MFLGAAEIGHGIYRAYAPELRDRRRAFLDELKATVPIHPVTEATTEIVAALAENPDQHRVLQGCVRRGVQGAGGVIWAVRKLRC